MSEFSKEYCLKHRKEFIGDFSILEEYKKLEKDEYISVICEGYGFIGILKEDDICKLIYTDDDDKLITISYDELESKYKDLI